MAPSAKKSQQQSAWPCEANLQSLRNCLVNLPSPLVSVLVDNNIVAQNVVIEVRWQPNAPSSAEPASPKRDAQKPVHKSVFVGWSGMSSRRKVAALVGKDGLQSRSGTREQEVHLLEIDATFAKLVGIADGQKVGILMHPEPPLVDTINIEPLTPADWEIIELHANFLELNLLNQLRAVPNPTHSRTAHPLTIHLSPTSTANIVVSGIKPSPPEKALFAKIAPGAEVIVAPKTRQRQPAVAGIEDDVRSSKSGASANTKTRRAEQPSSAKPAVFLRAIDRSLAAEWFNEDEETERDEGLKVWLDWSIIMAKEVRGADNVWVSIIRPPGVAEAIEEDPDALKPATRVIARVFPWEDAPNSQHVALSSLLAASLDAKLAVGDTVRIEPATSQATKSTVKSIRIIPFATSHDNSKSGFKFGGRLKADAREAAEKLVAMYGSGSGGNKLFDGPITDGMILPPPVKDSEHADTNWQGGVIKLHPPPGPPVDPSKTTRGWLVGSERKIVASTSTDSPSKVGGSDRRLFVELMPEIPPPLGASKKWTVGEDLPKESPVMVGIDPLIAQVRTNLQNISSTLLTGGIGAGKTSLACLVAHDLLRNSLFSVTYFPCRLLVTEETRIPTIKDTLNRLFSLAVWKARFGGKSLVILDDLDKLCPVETELEVGGQNERNRHVSELIMTIVREHCTLSTRVVLLATAQNKESVHNVIIGGHVVRETVHIQAPDKEARCKVLESLVQSETRIEEPSSKSKQNKGEDEEEKKHSSHMPTPGILPDAKLDYLDLAGKTDGYMPGDLKLLISRARSEALIRSLSTPYPTNNIILTTEDFFAALKGFTPASLRNVTLTQSSTTFSSIGGLRETRQTLLETLQYPTLYAPIFAKCPLRLRSGLLLYGFPGCGKTLLASAVAGECGLNFISVKGPEILNKYIGASEKSVRDLFERAQAARPCVLFFDEFDSVAPKRGHDSTGVTDRVVNQLLTQMDGAEGLSGVYVLAATSRPDMIDPALLRPGRLDKSLLCDMPDRADRLDILEAIGANLRLSPALRRPDGDPAATLRDLAARTDGFSGADLQAVVYNAHLEAIHDLLGDAGAAGSTKPVHGSRLPEFDYFRMGAGKGAEPLSAAQRAADRAKIAGTLAAQRAAAAKARAARRESDAAAAAAAGDVPPRSPTLTRPEAAGASRPNGAEKQSAEPEITWAHVLRALESTRPSISAAEVRRLRAIYREFVVGRSGELRDGQGGSEIGGRSSLM